MVNLRIFALIFYTFSGNIIFAQQSNLKCGAKEVFDFISTNHSGYSEEFNQMHYDFYSSRTSREITVCTVNVVVHLVYFDEFFNWDDSLVNQQIEVLNQRFNFLNADTTQLRAEFLPVTGSGSGIFFQLATTDPQGLPTNGIVRKQTDIDGFGTGDNFAENVKHEETGGSDAWDVTRYLNIWVCNTYDGQSSNLVLGYATPPPNLPNWPENFDGIVDGVVIQSDFFGTLIDGYGKTTVHEVGHYFGLRHIWGDLSDCLGDDGIDDTPAMAENSLFTCNPNANTCVDDIGGVDLPDMIENYMDYSSAACQVAFTNDQSEFMNWVLQSARPLLCWNTVNNKDVTSENIKLWPQPACQILNVGINESTYEIFNLSGSLIQSGDIMNGQIDVSGIASGMHLLHVKNGESSFYKKLYIQN